MFHFLKNRTLQSLKFGFIMNMVLNDKAQQSDISEFCDYSVTKKNRCHQLSLGEKKKVSYFVLTKT